MKIRIVCVGKLKEKAMKELVNEYSKRISAYSQIEIIEVPDKHAPDNISLKDIEKIKDNEGELIKTKILNNSYVIICDLNKKELTSEEFSKKIEDIKMYKSSITFIIGGSFGISEEIKELSDFKFTFSKLTFPHQLFRVILLEQIYRAFKIAKNEPYHK